MKIHLICFSPTHTTKTTLRAIAKTLAGKSGRKIIETDWTLPTGRQTVPEIGRSDWLILGMPVYGGRIPLLMEEQIKKLKGDKNPAIAVSVYGNRAFEDALLETKTLLEEQGFWVYTGAAFIAEHSYTSKLATNRPDSSDLSAASQFGEKSAEIIQQSAGQKPELSLEGHFPYKERKPKSGLVPTTTSQCIRCGMCIKNCPVGAIDKNDPGCTNPDLCITCFACVRGCPARAKEFDPPPVTKIIDWLIQNYSQPQKPTLFFPDSVL